MKKIVIIGGGLAGTFLAYRLIRAGQTVWLFDDGKPTAASRVAAGMFNVITGRFGAKSWQADLLLSEIEDFLQEADSRIKDCFHYMPIYRPFKEVAEYNKWQVRSKEEAYSHLVNFEEQTHLPDQLINPHGGIMIQTCGWARTRQLIARMQDWLMEQPHFNLYPWRLDYSQIHVASKEILRDGLSLSFDELVFCEGPTGRQNPYFGDLPLIPNKGELLELSIPDLSLSYLISKKVYLIPLGGDRFLTGSTYRNQFEDPGPSQEGLEEIQLNLTKLLKCDYQITDHLAGIRPTTRDRKPMLGSHAEIPYLHLLNGFGTKGVLLAPYCSKILSAYLLDREQGLPAEIDLKRFS